jgi:hypothetical protein
MTNHHCWNRNIETVWEIERSAGSVTKEDRLDAELDCRKQRADIDGDVSGNCGDNAASS